MRRLLLLLTTAIAATAHASPTPMDSPVRMSGLWLMNTAPLSAAAQTSSFTSADHVESRRDSTGSAL